MLRQHDTRLSTRSSEREQVSAIRWVDAHRVLIYRAAKLAEALSG